MGRLAEKLREARKLRIDAGGFVFLARRPTDLEMIELRGNGSSDRLLSFVYGWEGVKESDIVDHGDPHPAEFDRDDAREWLADRPDLFGGITKGLLAGYTAHTADLEERLKNSAPGSNSSTPQDSTQAINA